MRFVHLVHTIFSRWRHVKRLCDVERVVHGEADKENDANRLDSPERPPLLARSGQSRLVVWLHFDRFEL